MLSFISPLTLSRLVPSVEKSSEQRSALHRYPLRRPLVSQRPSRCQQPVMTISTDRPSASPTESRTKTSTYKQLVESFHRWFSLMPGVWNSERTYHYLDVLGTGSGKREASQTTFEVARLNEAEVNSVLAANQAEQGERGDKDDSEGMRVSFRTRMRGRDGEDEEEVYVMASTDLVMKIESSDLEKGKLMGVYLRSVGYEEGGPKKSEFSFDADRMEMSLTTWYEKVVSVDRICLLNEKLRTRNIINYLRPKSGKAEDLQIALLCGFGVEAKGRPEERLVS